VEGAGADAWRDHSGNGHHGRALGGAALRFDPMRGTVMRNSYWYQFVECEPDPAFDLTEGFTLSLWLKPDLPVPRKHGLIIMKGADGWRLILSPARRLSLHISGLRTTSYIFPATAALGVDGRMELEPGKWQHVAATFDGRRLTLYVAGREDTTELVVSGAMHTNDGPVRIAADRPLVLDEDGRPTPVGWQYSGLMDDIRVYRRALQPGEIQALSEGGTSVLARVCPAAC
jgi:hypothetical protein